MQVYFSQNQKKLIRQWGFAYSLSQSDLEYKMTGNLEMQNRQDLISARFYTERCNILRCHMYGRRRTDVISLLCFRFTSEQLQFTDIWQDLYSRSQCQKFPEVPSDGGTRAYEQQRLQWRFIDVLAAFDAGIASYLGGGGIPRN